MKITFETSAGTTCIYLSDKELAYTEEIGDSGVMVDFDEDGQVICIGILDTNMPEVEVV